MRSRRMPQHVRMNREGELGFDACAFDKTLKARGRERRVALTDEDEGRLWALLALELAKHTHHVALDWVNSRRALLRPQEVAKGFEAEIVFLAALERFAAFRRPPEHYTMVRAVSVVVSTSTAAVSSSAIHSRTTVSRLGLSAWSLSLLLRNSVKPVLLE